MTQTALDSFALEQGIGKTTSQMSEQEKVALRYQFVMQQLAGASCDFLRTSDGWANQTRVLKLQFDSLKATIGQGLINVLTPVLRVINSILAALQKVAAAFRTFTASIFGDASAGGQMQEVADGYEAAAGGAADLAESTEAAGKAAKKSTAGFDELNVLSSGSSGGGAAGGGGGGGLGSAVIPLGGEVQDNVSPQIEQIALKIKSYLDPLRNIDFEPLKTSLTSLLAPLELLGNAMMGGLAFGWFNILVPLSQWTIESFAPAAVNLLSSALNVLAQAVILVWDGLQQLWLLLQPVFQWIGDTVIVIVDYFREKFNQLAQTFSEKGTKIREIFSNIGEIFMIVWETFLRPTLEKIGNIFSIVFDHVWNVVNNVIGFVIDVFHGLTEFVAGVLTGDWSRAWAGIMEIFTSWKDTIKKTMESVKTMLVKIWSAIVNSIKGYINNMIGHINSMIAGIVNGINAVIGALNSVNFTIPDWIPGLGGSSFGINLGYVTAPQIPYLAKGAVIPPNAPFTAVLGDQRHGTNIEAPLETIKQALAEVMGQYGDITINFTGDLAQLARVLKPVIDRENKRRGTGLLKGAVI